METLINLLKSVRAVIAFPFCVVTIFFVFGFIVFGLITKAAIGEDNADDFLVVIDRIFNG